MFMAVAQRTLQPYTKYHQEDGYGRGVPSNASLLVGRIRF